MVSKRPIILNLMDTINSSFDIELFRGILKDSTQRRLNCRAFLGFLLLFLLISLLVVFWMDAKEKEEKKEVEVEEKQKEKKIQAINLANLSNNKKNNSPYFPKGKGKRVGGRKGGPRTKLLIRPSRPTTLPLPSSPQTSGLRAK